MTKTISAGMQTHLDGASTNLATIWTIIRLDGTTQRLTSHHNDLTDTSSPALTYTSSLVDSGTAIESTSTLKVDNLEVLGIVDNVTLVDDELRKGKYDYAEVKISSVNYLDMSLGEIKTKRGWIGEVTLDDNGLYHAELRGMTQALNQNFVSQYGPECDFSLGDSDCNIPIDPDLRANSTAYSVGDFVKVATSTASPAAQDYEVYENRIYECTVAGTSASSPPTMDTTVGNATIDSDASPGVLTWTTRQAWSRHAVVATITSNKIFSLTITEARAVDDWFNGGGVVFDSGDNSGLLIEVKDWVNSGSPLEYQVTLFEAAPYTLAVSDRLHIFPGCDKRKATCRDVFDNVTNFGGFPHIPGTDEVTRYPDAH